LPSPSPTCNRLCEAKQETCIAKRKDAMQKTRLSKSIPRPRATNHAPVHEKDECVHLRVPHLDVDVAVFAHPGDNTKGLGSRRACDNHNLFDLHHVPKRHQLTLPWPSLVSRNTFLWCKRFVAWLVSTHLKLIDIVDEEVLPTPPNIGNLLTCGWQERIRRNSGEKDGDFHFN